jgi:hypothetical protein
LTSQQLGSKLFSYKRAISDLDKINIAVISFRESGQVKRQKMLICLHCKELYSMFPTGMHQSADLGTILGNSIEDSYFALRKVVSIIKKNYTHSYRWFPRLDICALQVI